MFPASPADATRSTERRLSFPKTPEGQSPRSPSEGPSPGSRSPQVCPAQPGSPCTARCGAAHASLSGPVPSPSLAEGHLFPSPLPELTLGGGAGGGAFFARAAARPPRPAAASPSPPDAPRTPSDLDESEPCHRAPTEDDDGPLLGSPPLAALPAPVAAPAHAGLRPAIHWAASAAPSTTKGAAAAPSRLEEQRSARKAALAAAAVEERRHQEVRI